MNSVSQIVLPAALGLFCATAALAQNAPPVAGQHSQSSATSGPQGGQSTATSESHTNGSTSESQAGVTPSTATVEPRSTGTVNQSATSNQRTSSQRSNYSQIEPMSHDTVMAVQRRLQQDGFYHGTVDGQWGPSTQTSLSDFQRRNNLTANGELDQHTLDALNLNSTSNSTSNNASNNVQQRQSQSHSSSSSKTE